MAPALINEAIPDVGLTAQNPLLDQKQSLGSLTDEQVIASKYTTSGQSGSHELNMPNLEPATNLPASTRLRKMLLNTNKLVVCPGVYDGLSARIALDVGFDAMYMV